MLIPLAAILTFASALLITSGLRTRRVDVVDDRLRAVRAGLRPTTSTLDDPFVDRAIAPLFSALANTIMRLLPPSWIKATSRRLILAGSPIALSGFLIIWASFAVSLTFFGAFMADSSGASSLLKAI